MEATIVLSQPPGLQFQPIKLNDTIAEVSSNQPGIIEKTIVWWAIKLRIFYFACIILKRPLVIIKTFKALLSLRKNVWGGDIKKIYKVGNKYFFNMYTPGWPSKAYDSLIKSELRRHATTIIGDEKLSFVFLAVTRKCPMRCEHCFEWDNLNQKETFTKEDLFKVVDIYQQQGVLQFHFSGGEPMVRIKDLVAIMKYASKKSDCWVLTSGFNCTEENTRLLKQAGCKGIVVSIDHYIPEVHNLFRGNTHAFSNATNAVKVALQAGMAVAVSVCTTKSFIDGGHLLPYIDFAKNLGVHFVQLLEPKNVGHYDSKDVLLADHHIDKLESVFKKVNHAAAFRDYPTLMYHGYHQRRVGCFSGSRSIYIDSAGDVHACPFCHTKSYNILQVINSKNNKIPVKDNACPRYNSIA